MMNEACRVWLTSLWNRSKPADRLRSRNLGSVNDRSICSRSSEPAPWSDVSRLSPESPKPERSLLVSPPEHEFSPARALLDDDPAGD